MVHLLLLRSPWRCPGSFSFQKKTFQSSPALFTLVKYLSLVISPFCTIRAGTAGGSQDGLHALAPFFSLEALLLLLVLLGCTVLQQENVGGTKTRGKCHVGGQAISAVQLSPLWGTNNQQRKPHTMEGYSGRQSHETKLSHMGTLLNISLSGRIQYQKFTFIQFCLLI